MSLGRQTFPITSSRLEERDGVRAGQGFRTCPLGPPTKFRTPGGEQGGGHCHHFQSNPTELNLWPFCRLWALDLLGGCDRFLSHAHICQAHTLWVPISQLTPACTRVVHAHLRPHACTHTRVMWHVHHGATHVHTHTLKSFILPGPQAPLPSRLQRGCQKGDPGVLAVKWAREQSDGQVWVQAGEGGAHLRASSSMT